MAAVTEHLRRINITEAERRLGTNRKVIHRLIAEGVLKTVTLPPGMRGIILESSVDELLAKWKAESQAG